MSEKPRYSIIPGDAVRDQRLDGYALKVLALVGSYGGEAGWMWGSQGWMAEQLGMSRPLVHRCLKQLEEFGYVVTRPSEKGRGTKDYKTKMDGEFDVSRTRHVTNRTCHNGDVSRQGGQEVSHCLTQIDQEQINISSNEDIAADAALPFEEKALTPAKAPPRKAKKTAKPKTPISEDWDVDADLIQHCADFGYSEREARFIAFKFKTHFESSGAVKTDWRRTFQVWVSNETPWKVKQAAAQWRQNGATSSINPKILNATPETQRYLCQRYIDDRFWPADGGPLFTGVTDEVLKEFGLSRHGAAA